MSSTRQSRSATPPNLALYNIGVVVILVLARTGPGLYGIRFWPAVLAYAALAAGYLAAAVSQARRNAPG
jgi:hypothetical protein